jgi:pimeloyl-ACP methyl ester carboxylesterase
VITFELVEQGGNDVDVCLHDEQGNLHYAGSYEYGGGGTVSGCSDETGTLYGKYFSKDYFTAGGTWGQFLIEMEGNSWEGCYSPPTDDPGGTECALRWRGTKAEAPTEHLPIIFVPGFLGTEIGCPKSDFFDELWPDAPTPEFFNMRLDSTGTRNHPKGNTCNRNAEPGPVVYRAFGFDVYGSIRTFLRSLPNVKSYFFGYDWRMSAANPVTQRRLNNLVNRALAESGQEQVTIVAHSMGGLVTRWYVERNAAKVARVVTMGTPFWGAPKPWLALSHGLTGPPTDSWLPDLDTFIPNGELKAFAKNAFGAYFLYPSPAFYEQIGNWLGFASHFEGGYRDQDGTVAAVGDAKGNEALYRKALNAHATTLDHYAGTAGLDWQMVVGTGLDTVVQILEYDKGLPDYTFGNGDGTVPTLSAAQGQTDESRVHYVCGVEHALLPGNAEVQGLIKDFILDGAPIANPHPGGCDVPVP